MQLSLHYRYHVIYVLLTIWKCINQNYNMIIWIWPYDNPMGIYEENTAIKFNCIQILDFQFLIFKKKLNRIRAETIIQVT